ncbi:MAG: sugar ABC transporter permease, partial [Clostridia bacterium]|nr:sugar ABC transporter permease [Clostridia bacterium]
MKINKTLAVIKKNIPGWALIVPTVLLFTFLVWRPIIVGITYSFFDLQGFEPVRFVGFENYSQVLKDTNFTKTLVNTISYVV